METPPYSIHIRQEQTSGRNIKPKKKKNMAYWNLQHIENQWSQCSLLCLDEGNQNVHTGVLWSLLGRGPRKQMPTERNRGNWAIFHQIT